MTATFLTGCTSIDFDYKKCEASILSSLKTPSSYTLVETETFLEDMQLENVIGKYYPEKIDKPLLDELISLKEKRIQVKHVSVKYDADNLFGAALRENRWCNFLYVDGFVHDGEAQTDAGLIAENLGATDSEKVRNPFKKKLKSELLRDQGEDAEADVALGQEALDFANATIAGDGQSAAYDPFAADNRCCMPR